MEIEILSACGIFKGFSEDEIKAVLQKMNGRKNILIKAPTFITAEKEYLPWDLS